MGPLAQAWRCLTVTFFPAHNIGRFRVCHQYDIPETFQHLNRLNLVTILHFIQEAG